MPKIKLIKSKKGRPESKDPKVPILLMVRKSKIVGLNSVAIDKKSDEFKTKESELKRELYETIDFLRA
jgi:hypothetical protein